MKDDVCSLFRCLFVVDGFSRFVVVFGWRLGSAERQKPGQPFLGLDDQQSRPHDTQELELGCILDLISSHLTSLHFTHLLHYINSINLRYITSSFLFALPQHHPPRRHHSTPIYSGRQTGARLHKSDEISIRCMHKTGEGRERLYHKCRTKPSLRLNQHNPLDP